MKRQNKIITVPPRLKPGDTIGVAAPAGPFDKRAFERGVDVLKAWGYRVFLPPGLNQEEGYLAGLDAHRADLLNRLFADPEIKGVVCARGGYGSLRILDLLAYDMIRDHPKVFMGFSDITALISTIVDRCNLVAFHGPVLTSLGLENPETAAGMDAALTSRRLIEIEARDGQAICSGRCKGTVTGGNLATLCHLVGTVYMPDFRGRIVMLEDTAEAPYKIDRMLVHMRMAGCFDSVAGIVLGTFDNCGTREEVENIVGGIFKDLTIPILSGFDIGHGPVNLTVPIGIPATLDTDQRKLSFLESAVV